MTDNKKDISQIFKSRLGGYQAQVEKDEWLLTEISLHKKRFYRFGFSYFNIYYASLIVATFLLTIFLGIRYLAFQSTHPTQEQAYIRKDSTKQQQDFYQPQVSSVGRESEKEETKVPVEKDRALSFQSKIPTGKKEGAASSPQSLNEAKEQGPEKQPASSAASVTDSAKIMTPDRVSKEETEVFYITKQDTIYRYDTLRVKKGKRR